MAEGERAVSISEAGAAPPPPLSPSGCQHAEAGAFWLPGEFLHPERGSRTETIAWLKLLIVVGSWEPAALPAGKIST